jgi:hypothetical protein
LDDNEIRKHLAALAAIPAYIKLEH